MWHLFFLRHAANWFWEVSSKPQPPGHCQSVTACINYQQIIFAATKAAFISDYAWTKEPSDAPPESVARHVLHASCGCGSHVDLDGDLDVEPHKFVRKESATQSENKKF